MKKRTYANKSIEINGLKIESRKVSGYLAQFGIKDSQDDMFIKGCFAKSILEHGPDSASPQKIAYLFNHDFSDIVGKFTLLEERDLGLYFEAEIDPTKDGDDLLIRYSTGSVNQHSVRIKYIWDKMRYDSDTETYYIYECRLIEGSAVAVGAQEFTPFNGFKSDENRNDFIKLRLNKCLRGVEENKTIEITELFEDVISLLPEIKPIESLEQEEAETQEKTLDISKVINLIKNE